MDLKLAAFTGKLENFSAWLTKFVALMGTTGLFSTVMGKDDQPEAQPTLPESLSPTKPTIPRYRSKQC